VESGLDFLNWVAFGPSKLIAWQPYSGIWIGLAIIIAELSLSRRSVTASAKGFFRRPGVLAGLMWCLFNFYEWQVLAVLPKGTAGSELLRLDLIVLVPMLYALSGYTVFRWSRLVGSS